MAFDLATVDTILREVYRPALMERMFTENTILLRMLDKGGYEVTGRVHDSVLLFPRRQPVVIFEVDDVQV